MLDNADGDAEISDGLSELIVGSNEMTAAGSAGGNGWWYRYCRYVRRSIGRSITYGTYQRHVAVDSMTIFCIPRSP